jgi:hypothetical protein
VSRNTTLCAAVVLLVVAGLSGIWLRQRESGPGALPNPAGPAAADPSAPVRQAPPSGLQSPPEPAREVASSEGLPTAPAAEAARTIQILVLRQDDERPISGAKVTAYEVATNEGSERTMPAAIETGADGRCACRVATSASLVHLKVEKEGFFHVNAHYERLEQLTIRLMPTARLAGRVIAADTEVPVPGARIRLMHNYCKGCEPDLAIADAQGRYELPGVPRRQSTTFKLDAEGFASQWRRFEIRSDEPAVELDFRLQRGIEIAGSVVDYTTGAGLAGAKVGELQTDAAGTFRGRVLPAEGESAVELRVEADDHCILSASLGQERWTEPLEFRLPRGAIVEGTVRDGSSGAPIPAAVVGLDNDYLAQARANQKPEPPPLVLPEGWRFEPEGFNCKARTDEQGRFRIENAVPWSAWLKLSVFADGYATSSQNIERVRGPDDSTWVDLVLAPKVSQPEVRVSGQISLNGQSLRTAKGRVRWKGPSREGEAAIHTGKFYTSVEPGEVALHVEVDGLPAALEGSDSTLHVDPEKALEHVVELGLPTRPITGRVTFEDGGAAALASLEASVPLSGSGEGYWDRLHVSAKATEDGSYALEVPDLPALYRVVASLDEDERSVDGIRAGAGGVNFVFARGGVLLFRFRDARSDELLPADRFELGWKRLAEDEYHRIQVGWPSAPDPEGWYELRLPGGRLDLRASQEMRAGYLPASVENILIQPGESCRVEFEMHLGQSVELQLAPDEGPLTNDHTVLLIEEELWDGVQYWPDRGSWDGGKLGDAIMNRFVRFSDERRATIYGLGRGTFRFKVFPDDVVMEPAELEVGEELLEPVLVRWRER